jgi:hypothetical protein
MLKARRFLAASLLLCGLALTACGSSAQAPAPAAGRLVTVPGSSTGKIVLTQAGASHIGVQTTLTRGVPRSRQPNSPTAVIPYSSLVYAPDGATYAFTSPSALVYTEVPVTVANIQGDSVYLVKGPKPGSRVVTVGAEELLGVQSGVLEQT